MIMVAAVIMTMVLTTTKQRLSRLEVSSTMFVEAFSFPLPSPSPPRRHRHHRPSTLLSCSAFRSKYRERSLFCWGLDGAVASPDSCDDDNECIPPDFFDDYACKWINDNEKSTNSNYDYIIEPFQMVKGGSGGFCNRIYQVQNSTHTLLLKQFSNLAQERMSLMMMLPSYSISSRSPQLDERLGEFGLGPRIVDSYLPQALLMEYIQSPTLTEQDLFQSPPNLALLENIGQALYSLHHTAIRSQTSGSRNTGATKAKIPKDNSCIPRQQNMLWRSIDLLLERISSPGSKMYFTQEVQAQYQLLEMEFQLPMVSLGHGDCKPSNIILLQDQTDVRNDKNQKTHNNVRFLDLELTGYNYRAYDLAKLLFRRGNEIATKDGPLQSKCQDYVLSSYLKSSSTSEGDNDDHKKLLEKLRSECQLLLPMTWLEAALFFEATKDTVQAEHDDTKSQAWDALAQDRLENYQKACQSTAFLESVHAYRKNIGAQEIPKSSTI